MGVATMLFDKLGTDSLVKLGVELDTFIELIDDNDELTTKKDIIENNTIDKDKLLQPLVQELSGKNETNNQSDTIDALTDDEESGQETIFSVAAINDLKVRPLQDFGLNYTSETVAHKGNEDKQEKSFTIDRFESNGKLAD